MMEGFRKNYAVYYSVLFITGLWPFDQSLRSKILRTVFSVVILYCIGIQISTLRLVDMSVYNIVMVLSYGCPMLLYFLRYMGFVVNFPIIKCVFENIENDLATLKNPTEIELFSRQTLDARRVISVLIALMCAGITMIVVTLLIPTILESKLQIYFLNFFGFMYKERSQETNYVCVQIVFVSTIGLLSLACTEASLAVFSCYLCGLFEIASYRIRIAVNEMAKSASVTQSTNLIDIRSAVETHQRAIDGDRNRCHLVRCELISRKQHRCIFILVSMEIRISRLLSMCRSFSWRSRSCTKLRTRSSAQNSFWYT
ncbi:uncharacterized protein LOC117225605 isoform X5 [Megalopta genalis]|uniref:uncharacterized protein LOC117225605 isoform X5 n=1 Tax=Megalopta genalis TaxID=115081 RepID=UPI003FCF395F